MQNGFYGFSLNSGERTFCMQYILFQGKLFFWFCWQIIVFYFYLLWRYFFQDFLVLRFFSVLFSGFFFRIVEAAKLAYSNKTKESITSQKLGSRNFWRIANSFLNKGKSAIPPLFNGLEVLSSASDKAKWFAKNLSKNSNLDDLDIS